MGAHKRYFKCFLEKGKLVLANKYKHKLSVRKCFFYKKNAEKSRKRETKHLSTDADSNTDATDIEGSTKHTQKPNYY